MERVNRRLSLWGRGQTSTGHEGMTNHSSRDVDGNATPYQSAFESAGTDQESLSPPSPRARSAWGEGRGDEGQAARSAAYLLVNNRITVMREETADAHNLISTNPSLRWRSHRTNRSTSRSNSPIRIRVSAEKGFEENWACRYRYSSPIRREFRNSTRQGRDRRTRRRNQAGATMEKTCPAKTY